MQTAVALALVGLAISSALPTLAQQADTSPAPAATATAQRKDTVDPQVVEQVRALAAKYDEAFNKNDATALGALFSGDAVLSGLHGKFKDRQAIKKFPQPTGFRRWHASFNVARRANRVASFNLLPASTPNDRTLLSQVSMYCWRCAKKVLSIRCPA
jgi:hypothetical protein